MKIKFVFMLTIAILLSACSDDDVFTSTSLENSVKESENLTLQDYPSDTLYYEGQAVIVFHENENTLVDDKIQIYAVKHLVFK